MSNQRSIKENLASVMQQSADAFISYQQTSMVEKANFLEKIADNLEALGDELIQITMQETNLPAARLIGERGRTTMQLRMFATMLREGSWVDASIDTAIPDKVPAKPDIRKMMLPLGPVVVFGASNFPFAYSTAGGDTASALAAGCPVVVKGHPAHLQTSIKVAAAIADAIKETGMPEYVFQHVTDSSFEAGKALVEDTNTTAVGFTGSFSGGKALYDYASARKNPIPVFSEMGSVNPVVILPDTLAQNAESLAKQYAGSITLGMGQFCTNPGIIIVLKGEGLEQFKTQLSHEIAAVLPANLLHEGIRKAYYQKKQSALDQNGVTLLAETKKEDDSLKAQPTVASVDGATFLKNHLLQEEVFGPYSLVVVCDDLVQLTAVWRSLAGQLTTTIMGTDKDLTNYSSLLSIATTIAGRIVFNGVPTGVEVCPSMVHGGPFPASTDSRFTAVGIHAVKRWVRPVCFQNCPDTLLPDALKASNPLGIWRLKDNVFGKD